MSVKKNNMFLLFVSNLWAFCRNLLINFSITFSRFFVFFIFNKINLCLLQSENESVNEKCSSNTEIYSYLFIGVGVIALGVIVFYLFSKGSDSTPPPAPGMDPSVSIDLKDVGNVISSGLNESVAIVSSVLAITANSSELQNKISGERIGAVIPENVASENKICDAGIIEQTVESVLSENISTEALIGTGLAVSSAAASTLGLDFAYFIELGSLIISNPSYAIDFICGHIASLHIDIALVDQLKALTESVEFIKEKFVIKKFIFDYVYDPTSVSDFVKDVVDKTFSLYKYNWNLFLTAYYNVQEMIEQAALSNRKAPWPSHFISLSSPESAMFYQFNIESLLSGLIMSVFFQLEHLYYVFYGSKNGNFLWFFGPTLRSLNISKVIPLEKNGKNVTLTHGKLILKKEVFLLPPRNK